MIIYDRDKSTILLLKGILLIKDFKYLGLIIKGNGRQDKKITDKQAKVRRIYNMLRTSFFNKTAAKHGHSQQKLDSRGKSKE